MAKPQHTLTINGEQLSPRQCSELPNAASYAAIIKRISSRPELSDEEKVFLPMLSKSQCGNRGAKNSPFNNGNKPNPQYQQ